MLNYSEECSDMVSSALSNKKKTLDLASELLFIEPSIEDAQLIFDAWFDDDVETLGKWLLDKLNHNMIESLILKRANHACMNINDYKLLIGME